ncbi:AAA family ATPase [Algiphilus sp.]|uniref:ExeA family protein n=1 Tax=Algiphilus sp. TaxID=1872431 RepID=UPI0025BF1009|nr:AAA family ATPase [Algiphilus sp.]MCK5770062.1 AAA family ATPase [Algiphilus sp.]
MYTHFFRFSEPPFSITPDPAFLYLSPHHHEALAHLLYGTGESGGFVQLTGEVGTGKTTVIRTLLEQQMPEVDVALILNPRQTTTEFLQSICDELAVAYPDPGSPKQLVDALNRHLLATHAAGRRTVLIIDEAQNLSEDLLEQVRLLTNLETSKQKLLRIMLIGQPELDELLARPGLRQLAQRITARFHLAALSSDETAAYIAHRLRVVGGEPDLFDARSVRTIYRYSGGIPRLINVICDRALLAAYSAGSRDVTTDMVREAARSTAPRMRDEHGAPARVFRRSLPWVPGVALAGMLLVAWVWRAAPGDDAASPPDIAAASVHEPGPAPPKQASALERTTPGSAAPQLRMATGLSSLSATGSEQGSGTGGATPVEQVRGVGTNAGWFDVLPPLGDQVGMLLGMWDTGIRVPAERPVCEAITDYRLRCLRDKGDWRTLARYGRPAILTLIGPDGVRRHALLRSLAGPRATIATADGWQEIERDALDRLWNGDFLIVWRPEGSSAVLGPGDSGPEVAWLRRSLADATGEPVPGDDPATYDDELQSRVEAFQRAQGLTVDGRVGEKTRIVLLRALGPGTGPMLARTAEGG